MNLENLIEATKEFNIVQELIAKNENKVSWYNIQSLENIKNQYEVTIGQCEVFADVLKTPHLEAMIRDAIIEIYNNALLNLKTDYLDNGEKDKCDIADDIMGMLE